MNTYIKNVCTYTYISAFTHQVKLPNKAALEMVLAHNYHMKPEHFSQRSLLESEKYTHLMAISILLGLLLGQTKASAGSPQDLFYQAQCQNSARLLAKASFVLAVWAETCKQVSEDTEQFSAVTSDFLFN